MMTKSDLSTDDLFKLFFVVVGSGLVVFGIRDMIKRQLDPFVNGFLIFWIPADTFFLITIGLSLIVIGRWLVRKF